MVAVEKDWTAMTDDPTTGEGTMELADLRFDRCDWCGWPLAADRSQGCVADNCSQRPLPRPDGPAAREIFALRQMVRRLLSERAAGKREGIREERERCLEAVSDVLLRLGCEAPTNEDGRRLRDYADSWLRDAASAIDLAGQPEAGEQNHDQPEAGQGTSWIRTKTNESSSPGLPPAASPAPPSEAAPKCNCSKFDPTGMRQAGTHVPYCNVAAALRAAPPEKREADVLQAIEQRLVRAEQALSEACRNGFKLRACIPADPHGDSDIIIQDGLNAGREALSALRARAEGGS